MANKRWVVDSIEENSASVEQDGVTFHEVPRFLLPQDVKEGDVCDVSSDVTRKGTVITTVTIDDAATLAAKQRSAAQLAATPQSKDPGGPIHL